MMSLLLFETIVVIVILILGVVAIRRNSKLKSLVDES